MYRFVTYKQNKTQYFTVIAHKMQSSELSLKPEIYPPVIPAINQIINIPISRLVPLNNSEVGSLDKEISDIGKNIKVMKDNAHVSESISYHDIHQYTV